MRPRLRRLSVRARLLLGVLGLTTLELLAVDAGAAVLLHRSLTDSIDENLAAEQERLAQAEAVRGEPAPPAGFEPLSALSQALLAGDRVVEYRAADGTLLLRVPGDAATSPDLTGVDLVAAAGRPFDVPAAGRDDGAGYRVLVRTADQGRATATIGYDLASRDATVRRLGRAGLVLTAVVVGLVGVLGSLAVRIGLRPLLRVEHTAEAIIAGGDLSRRVRADAGPGTEAGRLSATFDTMLATIERAFQRRAASEARLRRFVADASHELRTPVTGIRGMAEMYRRGAVSDPAEVPRILARIEAEATRMGTIVADLLLLARLDQQRPLERAPVDLLVVAADAVHDARVVDPDRPIELEIVPAAGAGEEDPGPVVLGDEARLRQVAANLVSNARTHTPPGTPVTVRAGLTSARATDPGCRAVLEVADRGPGLAAADAARVFERFFRADRSRHRVPGTEPTAGAGLGLSIVEAIVTSHGGTVAHHPTPGGGATFRIELPLAPSDPAGGGTR